MGYRGKSYHAWLLAGAAAIAISSAASAAENAQFDIAPQPLASALNEFSLQSHQSVLFTTDLAAAKSSQGVSGQVQVADALSSVLAGTGLTWKKQGDTFLIVSASDPQSGSAAGDGAEGTVAALIVTAQKKEEAIQDVPIAISAFTEKSLEEQKIEGGFDLLKAIPNVTFSKNNFSSYNFSIRGIGTKAISVTTDPGVAVSFNSTTLIRNRLFEQEYFDVERVEVLRGPQGTLYGRNATSGVINVISAKPDMDEFKGSIKGEVGSYNTKRMVAMLNVPLVGEKLAVRLAGSFTNRDGYGIDLFDNTHVDGRDLWSARATIGFRPTESFRADLIWERFHEDDDRSRTSKQLCHRDPGPSSINGLDISGYGAYNRGFLSQGCLPGSLYDAGAYGAPNGIALPFVLALEGVVIGYHSPHDPSTYEGRVHPIPMDSDPYGSIEQSHDLRAIYSQIKPVYRASADVFELNLTADLPRGLTLVSQTAYDKDKYYASQDYNRYTTIPVFADTSDLVKANGDVALTRPIMPGGIFCDPQVGCSNTIVGQDLSRAKSLQFSQEIRLQSDWEGALNFSAGANYTRYHTIEDYYVFFNAITLASVVVVNTAPLVGAPGIPNKYTLHPDCSPGFDYSVVCSPIETNPISSIQDTGHNYFLSRNPYTLDSRSVFGELYWQAAADIKITAGLRYTDDRKTFTPIPSETLLTDPAHVPGLGIISGLALFGLGSGYPALPDVKQEWREVTGRVGADWKPVLSFTDQTMLYAFYSRGYKGGGMNPPRIGLNYDAAVELGVVYAPSAPPSFRPEFVNAFEVGAKNTLLGGSLVVNADAFFYDYKDYQVSKIVDRTANNENFDAKVWGLEFESVWQPSRNLRFNASLGYLNTELAKGSKSIDVMNRTAGHTDWMVVKPTVTLTSNCIAPTDLVETIYATWEPGIPMDIVEALCPGGDLFGGTFRSPPANPPGLPLYYGGMFGFSYDPAEHPEANYGAGFDTDVSGHELPNSPHYTVSLGGQYSRDVLDGWRATIRADFYWQSQSWARIYEQAIDKLHGWKNGNVRFTMEKPDDGLEIELYVKNVFDDTPITDTFTNSDDTALTTNVFTLDPRLVGLSIKKTF